MQVQSNQGFLKETNMRIEFQPNLPISFLFNFYNIPGHTIFSFIEM
jgi:hypothetical protein